MIEYRCVAENEQATERFGKLLADILPAGVVVALIGTLGAGKTRLVQGIATALGVAEGTVTSPTFVLAAEYLGGRLPIYHFDTYRLPSEDEFLELGPEEYFEGSGITLVEWADRVPGCLPEDYLIIRIEAQSETVREFIVTASTSALEPLVERLQHHVP